MTDPYLMTWGVSDKHGWGLVGLHLLLGMKKRNLQALLLEKPSYLLTEKRFLDVVEPLLETIDLFEDAKRSQGSKIEVSNTSVLHGLGNLCLEPPKWKRFRGKKNIALIAFEDTTLNKEVIDRAMEYDMVVTHSTFNRDLLKNAGVENVPLAWQGIDPFELLPKKRKNVFGEKFVVFAGGKIEYRKGQDLVLKAFRLFHEKHPDSILVTNWQSYWPEVSLSVNESNVLDQPLKISNGKLQIKQWAVDNGIAEDAFCDLGFVERAQISQNYAEADVAVFPNRCEGATNLVAKEAMFCRVPTILSANTGHNDLIDDEKNVCVPLKKQTQVANPDGSRTHWMESDVDEMVAALEWVYMHREEANKMAVNAFRFIGKERTWKTFADQCLDVFEGL